MATKTATKKAKTVMVRARVTTMTKDFVDHEAGEVFELPVEEAEFQLTEELVELVEDEG